MDVDARIARIILAVERGDLYAGAELLSELSEEEIERMPLVLLERLMNKTSKIDKV